MGEDNPWSVPTIPEHDGAPEPQPVNTPIDGVDLPTIDDAGGPTTDGGFGTTCATPQPLALDASGTASANGTTAGAADEQPNLRCGGSTPLAGPQRTFSLALSAGEHYTVALRPAFESFLVIVPAGACQLASMEAACSGGDGAFSGPIAASTEGKLSFSPASSGSFVIAVDSAGAAAAGAFELTVRLDCSHLDGACRRGVVVNGSCSAEPQSGAPCDDGDLCTTSDSCQGGTCVGTAKDCSGQGGVCTSSSCNPATGQCELQDIGGSCDDHDACTENDQCSGGSCSGTPRRTGPEPNESRGAAAFLSTVDACIVVDEQRQANLYPAGDVDWYRFGVTDNLLCGAYPRVSVDVPAGDVRLCAYFRCNNGAAVDLGCREGTWVDGPEQGMAGCCSQQGAAEPRKSVDLSPYCTFLGLGDDSGTIDVKVERQGGAVSCADYTLRWGG